MAKKFHAASYDDVRQVIRTRHRRHESFKDGMKRARAKLQPRPRDKQIHPLILGGLNLS